MVNNFFRYIFREKERERERKRDRDQQIDKKVVAVFFLFLQHHADCFLTKDDWAFFFNQRKNYGELQKGQQKVDIF